MQSKSPILIVTKSGSIYLVLLPVDTIIIRVSPPSYVKSIVVIIKLTGAAKLHAT
jgi:hypothetical protein